MSTIIWINIFSISNVLIKTTNKNIIELIYGKGYF